MAAAQKKVYPKKTEEEIYEATTNKIVALMRAESCRGRRAGMGRSVRRSSTSPSMGNPVVRTATP